jgi:DNA-binding NarL/FixJ family response regulator
MAIGRPDAAEAAVADAGAMQLLALLAGGLNDKAIASELDVSTRTLDRRILKLMRGLGARTRFQAGWIAAQRGRPDV